MNSDGQACSAPRASFSARRPRPPSAPPWTHAGPLSTAFGAALLAKLRSGRYDWNELNDLLPPDKTVAVGHLIATLEDRFRALAMPTEFERRVVADSPSGWNHALVEELRAHILARANRE